MSNKFQERLNTMSLERRHYILETLPRDLVNCEHFERLEHVLTDLYFIEAKCSSGMTSGIVLDYIAALDVLPENLIEKQKHLKHEGELKQYNEEMITYARAWNDARERHKFNIENNSMPRPEDIPLPAIIPSIELWNDEKILKETERIVNHPTRLDRLQAFSQFVNSESHSLAEFASYTGFTIQQAYNSASSGPVANAAERIINTHNYPCILLKALDWRHNYSSHPALLKTFEIHKGNITCICVTPDGKKAVSGSRDNKLIVWDLEIRQCLYTLEEHTSEITCVCITPDGKKTVSVGKDNKLIVWDLESRQYLITITSDGLRFVSITPDGKMAVTSGSFIEVWNVNRGEKLKWLYSEWDKRRKGIFRKSIFMQGGWHNATITPNGKSIFMTGWEYKGGERFTTLSIWNWETEKCPNKIISTGGGGAASVCIKPTGRRAILASGSHIMVWDTQRRKCLGRLEGHKSNVGSLDITADGRIAVSGSGAPYQSEYCVAVWDLNNMNCIKKYFGHDDIVRCISITPDGKTAISGSQDNTIKVWDVWRGEGHEIHRESKRKVPDVSVSPNGKKAVSIIPDSINLLLWDLENKSSKAITDKGSSYGSCVCITPDCKRAVSGDKGGALRVWDLDTGVCLTRLEKHGSMIESVCVTPDGKRIISGSHDYTLKLWDLESGECLRTYRGHTGQISSVANTPDGKKIVSGSGYLQSDNTIKIWDLESGECLLTIKGPPDRISSVASLAITPDGKKIVSGSGQRQSDHILKVWDLESGESLGILKGHTRHVNSVSITADGRIAVSGSTDRTLRAWNIQTSECIAVYHPGVTIHSISEISARKRFVIGTGTGEIILMSIQDLPINTPLMTPVRIWQFGNNKKAGCWDEVITVVCYWCGQRFPVEDEILDAIRLITLEVDRTQNQSPCRKLPAEIWKEPQIESQCPICHQPSRFNPFIVDKNEIF